MSNPLTPAQQAARIRRVVEIGMAYLQVGNVAHKQFAIEAMLALMTGCDNVPEFRRRFRDEANKWIDGTPL